MDKLTSRKSSSRTVKRSTISAATNRSKGSHFLTAKQRAILVVGSKYVQETTRIYRGPRIKRDKALHDARYARSSRLAGLAARGALEDLAWLVQTMPKEWVLSVLTDTRSLGVAGDVQSELGRRVGGPNTPLERFLAGVAQSIGLEHWTYADVLGGEVVGRVFTKTTILLRLLTSLQDGLNLDAGSVTHQLTHNVSPRRDDRAIGQRR